jgi:hypothetical protein
MSKIDTTKIKAGDRVQIADAWYEVSETKHGQIKVWVDMSDLYEGIITAHRPASEPAPEVSGVGWLTEEEWDQVRDEYGFYHPAGVNALLTRKYGDLKRQLAEARKDTERLEWLEAETWEFGRLPECRCPEPVSYPAYQVWMVNGKEFDTLRQAIDNAMKGQDDS